MARSLIRESQIVDEDVLSEEEHRNLDHTTLSGTGVVNSFIGLVDTPTDYSPGDYLVSTASGIVYSSVYTSGNRYVHSEVATQDQTVFSTSFSISNEFVHLNGVLLDSSDYYIGSNSITLASGTAASAGDIINIIAFPLPPLVTVTDFIQKTGDTMSGDLDMDGNDLDNVNNLNISSINDGPLAGFRNVLINGDFSIWQRGTTFNSVSDGNFSADRWTIDKAGSDTVNISMADNGSNVIYGIHTPKNRMSISITAGGGTSNVILQRIEDVRTLAGQTATLSFYAYTTVGPVTITPNLKQVFGSGGSSTVSYLGTGISLPATSWTKMTQSFALNSLSEKTIGTDDYLKLEIALPTNTTTTIYLADVQLEVGSVATPFEVRPIGLELNLCKRYYERLGESDGEIYVRQSGAGGVISMQFTMVEKRTIPTITKNGSWTVANCNQPAIGSPVGKRGFMVYASGASGDAYFITNGVNTFIVIDAEL